MEKGLVVPGDRLGPLSSYASGPGTYARNGFIYASTCGVQRVQQPGEDESTPSTSSPVQVSEALTLLHLTFFLVA
eukprot:1157461-Pelagomonas_calceolata.AAC.15